MWFSILFLRLLSISVQSVVFWAVAPPKCSGNLQCSHCHCLQGPQVPCPCGTPILGFPPADTGMWGLQVGLWASRQHLEFTAAPQPHHFSHSPQRVGSCPRFCSPIFPGANSAPQKDLAPSMRAEPRVMLAWGWSDGERWVSPAHRPVADLSRNIYLHSFSLFFFLSSL